MENSGQIFAILVLLLTFVVSVNITQFIRRGTLRPVLRRIGAYELLPRLIGRGLESGRPVHLSFGSASIGDESTPLALASAELFYHTTRGLAPGDVAPIVTTGETALIPLGMDTLRRAYRDRGLVARYNPADVRWYPPGRRAIAFAAALSAMMGVEKTAASVLAGRYGIELALILDGGTRRGQPALAATDQLEGQAVAYVLAEGALLGDEIFAAGSYLDESAGLKSIAVTVDVLRWLLVAFIVLAVVLRLIGG